MGPLRLLILLLAAAAVIGSVLIAVAVPRLAVPPAPTALAAPPLPVAQPGAVAHVLDLLPSYPIVATTGDASAQDYAQARIDNPSPAETMFADAWHAILPASASAQDSTDLASFESALLQGQFTNPWIPPRIPFTATVTPSSGRMFSNSDAVGATNPFRGYHVSPYPGRVGGWFQSASGSVDGSPIVFYYHASLFAQNSDASAAHGEVVARIQALGARCTTTAQPCPAYQIAAGRQIVSAGVVQGDMLVESMGVISGGVFTPQLVSDITADLQSLETVAPGGQVVTGQSERLGRDLSTVPEAAARINNAAVALLVLNVDMATAAQKQHPLTGVTVDGRPYAPFDSSLAPTQLLTWANWALPPNLPLRLNQAALGSANDVLALDTPNLPASLRRGIRVAAAVNVALSGSSPALQASRGAEIVSPLLKDPTARPLAAATIGDIYLYAAQQADRAQQLYSVHDLAQSALEAYDHALQNTVDPGVYEGRAAALKLLASAPDAPVGALSDAIASQSRATQIDPSSQSAWTTLAELQGSADRGAGMAASAAHALTLQLRPAAPLDPLVKDHQLTFSCQGYPLGSLGLSYGADGTIVTAASGCGAGGGVFGGDLIPRTDAPAGFYGDAVGLLAEATILTHNLQTPWGELRRLAIYSPGDQYTINEAYFANGRPIPFPAVDPNAAIDSLQAAQGALRSAGQFHAAWSLCARAAGTRGAIQEVALRCAGESAYLAGNSTAASQYFRRAYDVAAARPSILDGFSPGILLLQQATSLDAAHSPLAEPLYGCVARLRNVCRGAGPVPAPDPYDELIAYQNLGDAHLKAGLANGTASEYRAANGYYSRAITIERRLSNPSDPLNTAAGGEPAGTTTSEAHAFNNRGIATLSLLPRIQDGEDSGAPDCSGHMAACRNADSDFASALALVPGDPIYLLNAGWTARILGHDSVAQHDLQAAIGHYPALFPALNDLGVLAARRGDVQTARTDFAAALAAAATTVGSSAADASACGGSTARSGPRIYDLAAWNLGLSDLQAGIRQAFQGLAWQALAIRSNGSFRREELAYRTDNRVYCFLSGANAQGGASLISSYGLAAAGFSLIALLSALGGGHVVGLLRTWLAEGTKERLTDLTDKNAPRLHHAARRRVRRSLRRPAVRRAASFPPVRRLLFKRVEGDLAPWLLTLPVVVVVAAVGINQETPQFFTAMLALTILATAIAIVVHEGGHEIGILWAGGRLQRRSWNPGVALSLLLLLTPAGLGVRLSPFVGHGVVGALERRVWWVYAAGPLANVFMAILAYALYLAEPMTILRLISVTQLAVAGYSLLPVEQMDGHSLAKRRRPVALLGLALTVAGIAFELHWL